MAHSVRGMYVVGHTPDNLPDNSGAGRDSGQEATWRGLPARKIVLRFTRRDRCYINQAKWDRVTHNSPLCHFRILGLTFLGLLWLFVT